MIRFEIDRVDVLIFFRRVFSVLDSSVRPPVEPLGVLFHIGVVRTALKRDIQSYLDTVLRCLRNQLLKIIHGAKLRVDSFVAALV